MLAQFAQQGPKLVGTGAVGNAFQGSVALSADGSTAIVGGGVDNSDIGAAGGFTRGGGVGASGAPSWSAPGQWEAPHKAPPSRCLPTAAPQSWGGLETTWGGLETT